eukprot:6383117-Amphidinium_carterae.2
MQSQQLATVFLLITTIRSHVVSNVGQIQPRTTMAENNDIDVNMLPRLTVTTLRYLHPVEGDTQNKIRLLQQMQEVDDDKNFPQDEQRRRRDENMEPE